MARGGTLLHGPAGLTLEGVRQPENARWVGRFASDHSNTRFHSCVLHASSAMLPCAWPSSRFIPRSPSGVAVKAGGRLLLVLLSCWPDSIQERVVIPANPACAAWAGSSGNFAPRRPSHDGRNSLEAFKTPGLRFPLFNSSGDTPMVPRTVVPHTVVSHNALQVESK